MRFLFYAAAIALACIPQCLAMTWEQVYGSVKSMQKMGTGGWTTWYARVTLGEEFTSDISYSSLLEVAEAHWNYVRKQSNAFTTGGSCLVAAVYVPGGNVILSTIPRGSAARTDTMLGEMMKGAATNAPHWWAGRTGRRLDAEDGAVYLTEVEGYIEKHGLKLAVYGTHKGSGDTIGGPVNPCGDCKTMLGPTKMNIPFFSSSSIPDDDADQYAAEQLFKRSQEKRVIKTSKKSSSSSTKTSSTKTASTKTSSTSSVKATTSSGTSVSSSKAASSITTATGSEISSITTAKTSSASSSDTKVISSGTKASSASGSSTNTMVTPIKLTPVPFTISLSDQPDYDMGSTAAAATATASKQTPSSSSSVKGITATGTSAAATSVSVTAPTTLQTSTLKQVTASA